MPATPAYRLRPLLAALLALACLIAPTPSRAAGPYGSYTMGEITFDRGTNGCFGTVVGVYGSDTMKGYVLQTARDFCDTQLGSGSSYNKTTDVEWASGGTSCDGVRYAASHSDDNEVGASEVFVGSCPDATASSTSGLTDTVIAVNVISAITACAGALSPQDSPRADGVQGVTCQGTARRAGKPCRTPLIAPLYYGAGDTFQPPALFAAPDDVSQHTARQLWGGHIADYGTIGGCQGIRPALQQSTPDLGESAIWCKSIYGATPAGECANTTGRKPARSQREMLTDVCGYPLGYFGTGTVTGYQGPVDPPGTLGYVSRASLIDGGTLASLRSILPFPNCGVLSLNGMNGYSDQQVASGAYPAWGYLHLDLNARAARTGKNSGAHDYVAYLSDRTVYANDSDAPANIPGDLQARHAELQQRGFIPLCQMHVARTRDNGPYSRVKPTC